MSSRGGLPITALSEPMNNPLSTAILRYSLRVKATSDGPGPHETRPLGLRFSALIPGVLIT